MYEVISITFEVEGTSPASHLKWFDAEMHFLGLSLPATKPATTVKVRVKVVWECGFVFQGTYVFKEPAEATEQGATALADFVGTYVNSESLRVGARWTTMELQEAFDSVANPNDWKAPIRAYVDADDLEKVKAAIEWFTATPARLSSKQANGKFRIEADGYRAGPAGP